MSRYGWRGKRPGWFVVVLYVNKMEQGDLGVQAKGGMIVQRQWKKCQRTFSNPSLRIGKMRDEMRKEKRKDVEGRRKYDTWKEFIDEEI